MSSLAVPVRDSPAGPVVAAISMVGPTRRVVGDHESDHARVLKAGARRLTLAIADGGFTASFREA
jgi:DNA-binding IclR family transcriptional regulator